MENPFDVIEKYCKTVNLFHPFKLGACIDLQRIKEGCGYTRNSPIADYIESVIELDVNVLKIPLNKPKEEFINDIFKYCGSNTE